MALGDEKFYTLDGQEIDRSVLVQKMIDYFNGKYPNTSITDFNEGSEIRNLLEAIAVAIFHLEVDNQQILAASFLSTTYGSYLDLFGEELNTTRYLGSVSWGTVTFSLQEPVNYNIAIPAGTILVSETTGLYYETNLDCEIPIGEISVDCPCYSQVYGEVTNAEANTISMFKELNLYNEVSITNSEAFTGGRDKEDDEHYRQRLLEVKAQDRFGSREYYNRLGLSIDGVHDVTIVDSAQHTGKVLINGYTKPLPDSVLSQVMEVYLSEDNVVYNQSFEVEETNYTNTPLEITAVVTDEVSDSIFEEVLALFFNGGDSIINNQPMTYKGVNINEEVTNYQLLSVLESLPFVVQITSLTSDNSTFNTLTPDTNEVLELGTVTIIQQVAE